MLIVIQLFSVASLAVRLNPNINRNMAKHALKMTYTSTVNTFIGSVWQQMGILFTGRDL